MKVSRPEKSGINSHYLVFMPVFIVFVSCILVCTYLLSFVFIIIEIIS